MNLAPALLAAAGLALSGPLWAQVTKCSNAAGEITYSSSPCAAIGLKEAGPIDDRVTVVHQPPLPPAPPRPVARPPAVAAAPEAPPAPPPVPERRCFTIKTPTGLATRCNDKPPPD